VKFEWDSAKDRANRKKHGLSFSEAKKLFESGEDFLEIFDDTHSDDEERFIAIGQIRRGLIVVIWTERTEDTIRIISARWATKREEELFHEYMRQQ
jgi:uncharacterized DUF497 family protein